MNCKPGDLAVISRVRRADSRWMLGRMVRCERFEIQAGQPGWWLETAIPEPDPGVWEWQWIADYCLTPIRDPGDDAVDETLQRFPAPREAVPA